MVGMEPGIDAQDAKQAAAQQASTGKQDCRETKLENGERITRDSALGSRRFPMAFFERCVQVKFRAGKGRRESKKQAGKNRNAEGESEDAPVEIDFREARQVLIALSSNEDESCFGKEES